MSDSDMAATTAEAQRLIQLCDEDNKNSSSGSNDDIENNVRAKTNSKRCLQQSQYEVTCAMIEEIFGKEEKEEDSRRIKKRRFRLLESIYKETKPVKVRHGKNLCFL